MKIQFPVTLSLICLFWATVSSGPPSDRRDRADARLPSAPAIRPVDISDRAFNISDVNKLGQYISNIGQFYSSWQELGPTCEWPLGSAHEQMYRMNLYIGIPGNVVQTRTYGTKEWDPVGGYHNPEKGLLAISTDTETWPVNNQGQPYWPERDAEGDELIISHQDTYGVFRDLTNYLAATDTTRRLDIIVHQSSYAWNTSPDEDYIILKYDLINASGQLRDSVYFCMYCDFDAGGFESGNEFGDDRLGLELERQFFYFYDADDYSDQWNGPPFHIGLVFLQTPQVNGVQPGLTDWHYTDNWNEPRDIVDDVQQYGVMSSDPDLRADSLNWPDLFHGDNLHYDDPALIRETGDTLVVFASSGPYRMEAGDTIRFVVAMVAGEDYSDISENVDRIWEVYENGYQVKSVPSPMITGSEEDGHVSLIWDNSIDREYIDPLAGRNTLRHYRIYKTEDPNQLTWTLYDSVTRQFDENDPYRSDAYRWTDEQVDNGFYYSYSVTAFDSAGDESGIAILSANINTVELRPRESAQNSVNEVKVVPNPYVISAQWERERLGNIPDGEPVRELAFINLPERCTIRVFTIDGDLIKVLEHSSGTGREYWDIRSDYNQMIATGVYFFHVTAPEGEKIGKFAVIR